MKKIYQLIPILVLLFTSLHSQAAHVVGADVSYTCTSTPGVYKVTLKVYRDCVGILLCTGCQNAIPNGTTAGCTTVNAFFNTPITGVDSPFVGQSFGSYTLSAVSGANGYDIIQTCNSTTTKTICTNCNTRTAGTFSPGIEIFIFEGNVNLNALPSACCKVALGFSACCRNSAITLFQPGNFYTEAIVNRCITPCNGAPIFTNEAVATVCTNIDFVYNLGAIDPDGDSLSYALGESLQGQGAGVSWNAPFNANYPFNYLGAPNFIAPYPAGLRVDPITGDVMFRPLGVFISNLVIEVKQWKLVGGVRVNVGTTRRDVQFQTALCANNLPPRIKILRNGILQTGQEFSVCAGQQICLQIVAQDQSQTSPSAIIADTTDLTWNNPGQFNPAMANATWFPAYLASQRGVQGPIADSFHFCWTPPVSAARDMPHTFTVKGVDRFCPLPASAIRGINIKVVDIPRPIISTIDNLCGNRVLRFQLSNSNAIVLNASASQWQIEQTPGTGTFVNIAAPTVAGGGPNNGSINYRFTQAGTYRIRLKLNSTLPSPNGCPSLDSAFIVNKEPLKVTASNGYNCIGSSVTMKAQASGGNRLANLAYYEFFLGGISSSNSIKGAPIGLSVDSTLTISPTSVGSNTTYKVVVKDFDGCKDSTTFNVLTRALPIRELNPTIRLCEGEDTSLFVGNNAGGHSIVKAYWYRAPNLTLVQDSQANFAIKNVKFSDSSTFVLRKTDVFGCSILDSTQLRINLPVSFNSKQDSGCVSNASFPLRGRMSTMYIDSFVWYNINTGNRILENDTFLHPTNNVGIFSYKLRAYSQYDDKTCYSDDTAVFKVNIATVIANSPTPVPLCQNQGLYTLGTVATSTPTTAQTSQVWSYPPNPNAFPIPNNKKIISIDSLKYLPPVNNWNGSAFGNYVYVDVKSNITGCIARDSVVLGIFPATPINLVTPSRICDFDSKYSLYAITRLINAAGTNENWVGNGVTYDAGINRWFFNPSDTPNIVAGNNIGGKVRAGLTNITDSNILRYTFNRQFPANIQAGFNLIPARAPINMASPVGGCATSDTVILRVRKSPKLRAGSLPTICVGNDSVFLSSRAVPGTNSTTAANPATSYWYFAAPNNHLKAIVRGQVFVPFHSSIVIANGGQRQYKLYYGDTATGCNVIDSANLNVKGLPIVDISLSKSSDSAVCLTNNNVPLLLTPNPTFLNTPQDSFTLTGAPGLVANYGQANGLFNFIATGVQENTYKLKYYYRAPEGKGCHNSDSINVRVQFPPKVNLGPDANVCDKNGIFKVKVANPPARYAKHPYGLQWQVINQTGTILSQNTDSMLYQASASEIIAGKIQVRVTTTNLGQCLIPAIDTAQYNIPKSPVIGTITGNVNANIGTVPFNFSLAAQPNTTSFNWTVNNGTIQNGQGSKTVSILFTNKGAAKISVKITDNYGCQDSTSLAISVQNVGVQNIDINTALSVYPNPSKTLITISNKTRNLAGREYRICNLVGQTLMSGKLNTEETQVNIESLSSGVYLLSIEGLNSQSIKVVKE